MVKAGITFLLQNSLFLIGGTIIALVWANVSHELYEHVTHQWHFAVNDIGMAVFFALMAAEIREALLPGGSLSSMKRALLPLIATAGGMLGPASLYALGCLGLGAGELTRGWAIPCATDIAFSYLAAKFIFGAKHPAIVFLLLLAIADDAGGLLILAIFYPTGELALAQFAMLVGSALLVAMALRKLGIISFWPYLLGPGILSWFGFWWGGLHPALSLVPIMFTLPHAKVDLGLFAESEEGERDTLNSFEHFFKNPVELLLGIFGLVNAGVLFSSVNTATWLVLAGLLLGKPLGITLCSLVACKAGLALPEGMTKKDLLVVGIIAGMGFTVAIFVATAAFPAGAVLDGAKMGALFSFGAGGIAFAAARILGVRRHEAMPAVAVAIMTEAETA